MRFAVYGMGGFGREVAPLVREFLTSHNPGHNSGKLPDLVFVDDGSDRPRECNGYPVVSFAELTSEDHRDRRVVVAVADGRTRRAIEDRCIAAGLQIGDISAPTARVLDCVEIGPGAILCDGVILTSNIRIGKSFHANVNSYVAHDCVIGDYVTFAPSVHCNGTIHIGDFAYIGTGAMFIQGRGDRPMTIGEGALVGMGAVVTKPVEPYTVVAGNPAKAIRKLTPPA